jgi:hypothetical protein
MRRAFVGAAMVVAGIAALIVAHTHRPGPLAALGREFAGPNVLGRLTLRGGPSEWSQTAYDLVRIGGWGLIVFGAVWSRWD